MYLNTMPKFIKGKKLSESFFNEIVKPILKKNYSTLKYSAGLIGNGSDVIDYDTSRSMDHDWGPRVLLFLSKKDFKKRSQISNIFSKELPYTFKGFSTNFETAGEEGVKVLKKINSGKIDHRIEIFTIESFFKEYLNFNVKKDISIYDWLIFPEHKLLTITAGKIFHDDLGLKNVVEKFQYYPKDVWYYLLASQWKRISPTEQFMGRCGELKDELGSKIIASRLVKDIMKMCFLIEKKYTPYLKWFGTGFNTLKSSKKLKPILNKIMNSKNWKTREKYLSEAYEYLAKMHNSLKITKPMKTKVSRFYGRPYLVINGGSFASNIKKQIKNPKLKSLDLGLGSINQLSDSTHVFEANTQKFKSVYK